MMSAVQPFLDLTPCIWIPVRDGNDSARAIFDRHYSRYRYVDGRKPKLFVGPGEKLVLMTPCARALFAWRKFRSMDKQEGINAAIFRNEGAGLSSDLIRSASDIAFSKWPLDFRLYTYVNPCKVASRNPGYCFIRAGWRRCGVRKGGLLIFELLRDAP